MADRRNPRPVKITELREMRQMAEGGLGVTLIGRAFDRPHSVIQYYCRDLIPLRFSIGERRDEIICLYETCPRGERARLAHRLGFSSYGSLRTAICNWRKEAREAREAA